MATKKKNKHKKRKGYPKKHRNKNTQEKKRASLSVSETLKHEKVPFEKPGNSLYPAPAVLVGCIDKETGEKNLFTAGWAGNICSDPPMLSVSVRKERHSHHMIEESGEFTINLTTAAMAEAVDFCGVRSGRDMNKWEKTGLTPEESTSISAPSVHQSPVSIECRVRNQIELGTHDMFIGEVLAVTADSAYFDKKGAFHLEDSGLIAYSHGKYYALGKKLGYFGYSVRKKKH